MDTISKSLGLFPLNFTDYELLQKEFIELQKYSKRRVAGSMHPETKKAISQTLMGHETSKETRKKISKTVSIRNLEKSCGFGLGHAKKAGKIGGKSKSNKKLVSVKNNQTKSLETIRGSFWMINLDTNVRKRVPKNKVEKYKSIGFTLGAKGKG